MKKILPILSLFLASCASYHTHHSEGVYEDEGYYTSDYDPYYGYGGQSIGYSTDGSGVYFNDYNYYPDRWGINYSSSYYSPYRYPRIGFYYRDCFYWTWGCSGYGGYHSWSSYSPWFYGGVTYSSWYYDDYYWYNRWRHRNYEYQHPRYGGHNSARREAIRLANRTHGNRYKYQQPTRHGIKPNRVSRDRSRYSAPNREPVRTITPRTKQPRVKQPYSNPAANNYRSRTTVINKPHSSRQELRNQTSQNRQDAWASRQLKPAGSIRQEPAQPNRSRQMPTYTRSRTTEVNHKPHSSRQELRGQTSQNRQEAWVSRQLKPAGNIRQEPAQPNRSRQMPTYTRSRTTEVNHKPLPKAQFKKPSRIKKSAQASRTYNKPKANYSNKEARSKSKGTSSRAEKNSRSRRK